MGDIFLNFVGFNFKFTFQSIEWDYIKNRIKKEMSSYYKGFLLDKEPSKIDFTIKFIFDKGPTMIFFEKTQKKFIFFYKMKKKKVFCSHHINPFQFELILRHIIPLLLDSNGFVLHASAVNYQGKAYVFVGRPGAGKSTTMKFLSSKHVPLGDDTVVIREKEKNKFFVYQTPFVEKENWFDRKKGELPLGKIFFVKKAKDFKIEKIINKEDYVINRLMIQIFSLFKPGLVKKGFVEKRMKFLMSFVKKFNYFYFLYCAKDREKLTKLIESYDEADKN